jgi:biopolymer transport protein ExbD
MRRGGIMRRRGRKSVNTVFELQLTSMLDMLVIILVFLLKSYQTSTNNFESVKGMQLPYSKSEESPANSLHLIITPESMTFESDRVLDFVQSADSIGSADAKYSFKKNDIDENGLRVRPLFEALTKAREKAEFLRAKSKARDEKGEPLPFDGVIAIQVDKRVNYEILRKVMYTAGAAGYKTFRFLAMKRET